MNLPTRPRRTRRRPPLGGTKAEVDIDAHRCEDRSTISYLGAMMEVRGLSLARSTPKSLVAMLASLGILLAVVPAASSALARGVHASSPTVHLTGAGSTFDAPFFAAAFAKYHEIHSNVSVSYAAVGSSKGIARFSADTVSFGASDVPIAAAEQSAAVGGAVIQVPVDLGAVVVSYHVPIAGPASPIRLTGPVIARIFLGQITNWNDPAIAVLNPSLGLPNLPITVIHRSDGSGTTYIFTNYLSSVSPAWASGLGTNKSIKWPVGYGGKGSSGVAALLKEIPGSIGYFELSYAETQFLPYVLIENAAGSFVPPFPANVAADAAMKPNISALDFSIVDEPGSASYPISGYSWMLLYAHQKSARVAAALVALATWMTHAGQDEAATHFYVPLPQKVRNLASNTLARIVGPSH